MKIVCDSCGAKYSIADEKVAGKVFRIRCKKCGAAIVVRGDQQAAHSHPPEAASAQAPAVADSPDAIWHVVVDGDQQGPYTPGQVAELLAQNRLDWDSYVWREGFEGWQPARDVPELVDVISGRSGSAQRGREDSMSGMGRDPFASATSEADAQRSGESRSGESSGSGLFGGGAAAAFGASVRASERPAMASRMSRDSGADLFAQNEHTEVASSPFGGEGSDVISSSAGARAGGPMTGARNENSVLFSLSNLQALATGGSQAESPARPAPNGGRPGLASGEGSGLIDIRALASSTGTGGGARRASVDELLSIGAAATPFTATLGAPVLAPEKPESNNKLLYAIVGAAGLLAVALVVVVVLLLNRPAAPVATAPSTPGAETAGSGGGAAPQPTGEKPAGGSEATAVGAVAAANQEDKGRGASADERSRDDSENRGGRRGSSSGSSSRRGSSSRGKSGDDSAKEPAAAEPAAPARGRGGGDIDSLLEKALTPGSGGGRSKGSSDGERGGGGGGEDLPDTPPRDAVLSALRSVQGDVAACGGGQSGVANTAITVNGPTGKVSSAIVSGQFAGTPVASCVSRAVKGAHFPRFKRPSFQVSFPYSIR